MDVKFKEATEAKILSLKVGDASWIERAFYYPTDIEGVFYQVLNGVMRKFDCTNTGKGSGGGTIDPIGILLNDKMYSGYKMLISNTDTLFVPEDYEYHGNYLTINGLVTCSGIISIG